MTQDMIGRNGHQRWPETLHEINKIWENLPEKYRFNHRSKTIEPEFINRDFSKHDFRVSINGSICSFSELQIFSYKAVMSNVGFSQKHFSVIGVRRDSMSLIERMFLK